MQIKIFKLLGYESGVKRLGYTSGYGSTSIDAVDITSSHDVSDECQSKAVDEATSVPLNYVMPMPTYDASSETNTVSEFGATDSADAHQLHHQR